MHSMRTSESEIRISRVFAAESRLLLALSVVNLTVAIIDLLGLLHIFGLMNVMHMVSENSAIAMVQGVLWITALALSLVLAPLLWSLWKPIMSRANGQSKN